MTIERFKLSIGGNETEGYITDKIEHKTYFLRSDDVKKEITGILNQFYNENEDLKTDISVLNKHYDEYANVCAKLKKENEQLKSDNNRLVNETAKIVAEHQRKVFKLIDEKINEYIYKEKLYKHKGKDREASVFNLYCFFLNNLKKELSE